MTKNFALTLTLTILVSTPATPCVVEFGYTSTPRSEIDSVVANVNVGTAYITLGNETENLVSDVQYINTKAGPVFINIENIIWNPTPTTVMNCPYERGQTGIALAHTNLRGSYQAKIDTFFAINSDLFRGTRKVYGLILNSEANNRCVEPWKLNAAANYVKTKLAAVAQYMPVYTIVGYGLRNTPAIGGYGPIVSKGFPVNSNGSIAKFPGNVDVIAYYVYDIFNPNDPMHHLNVNVESWTSLNGKLNQALAFGQKTLGVVKAFCNNSDPVEQAWGVNCPNSAIWKIGTAASHWASYLRADGRNLFMLGFDWPSGGFYGSKDLSPVWSFHTSIQQQVNCSVP